MKTEKELLKEALKKVAPKAYDKLSHYIFTHPSSDLITFEQFCGGVQLRNAEVKQVIEDEMGLLKITEESFKFELKLLQKLLQKLGLGK